MMPRIDMDEIMGEIFRLEWSMNHEFVHRQGVISEEIPEAQAL